MVKLRYFGNLPSVAGMLLCALVVGCGEEEPTRNRGTVFAGAGGMDGAGVGGAAATAGAAGMTPAGTGGAVAGAGGAVAGAGGVGGDQLPVGRVFDAGSDPDRNNVQGGNVCDRLATIQCAGEAFCCLNPGRDQTTCKATMMDGCKNDAYLDVISGDPKSGFDAGAAAIAFTEFERLASTCDPSIAAFGAAFDGLRGIQKGTLAPGSSCEPDLVTSVPQAAVSLASCANPQQSACVPGLLDWACKPVESQGGRCFTDVNCVDGLYCTNPDLDLPSSRTVCAARKPVGMPCELPNECQTLFCVGGTCGASNAQNAYCLE